ncbi:MAG: diaminopimelate epimerase [Chlamydiales bacterium]
MIRNFPFSKYHGAGNDFILIDDREAHFPCDSFYIKQLCHRQYGIGADGLILLQRSTLAHGRMRIFNADGGEAEMCGNGIRCLFDFAYRLGAIEKEARIEVSSSIYKCSFEKNQVKVLLPMPTYCPDTGIVNSGVPHFVQFVENLDHFEVEKRGREIRFDVRFMPHGSNVTFAEIIKDKVKIRTYERGVERETLACGTGAVAAAFLVLQKFASKHPVSIVTSSNEKLEVVQTKNGMELIGPATEVFTGIIKGDFR